MLLLKMNSARNATATFSIFPTNEGPCWRTGPSFMPDRAMKKNAWIAIEIWFTIQKPVYEYKQYQNIYEDWVTIKPSIISMYAMKGGDADYEEIMRRISDDADPGLCHGDVLLVHRHGTEHSKRQRVSNRTEHAKGGGGLHRMPQTGTPRTFCRLGSQPPCQRQHHLLDCHQAEESDPDVSQEHYKQYERSDQAYGTKEYKVPITAVVTPKDCSRCHPDEAKQYSISKHANTMEIIWKIDPWLNKGMNSDFERATGCYHCHGPF